MRTLIGGGRSYKYLRNWITMVVSLMDNTKALELVGVLHTLMSCGIDVTKLVGSEQSCQNEISRHNDNPNMVVASLSSDKHKDI